MNTQTLLNSVRTKRFVYRGLRGKIQVVRKTAYSQSTPAEAISTLENQPILQAGNGVHSQQQPAKDVVSLNIRLSNAKLQRFLIDLFSGDHNKSYNKSSGTDGDDRRPEA
jgi:hypothetical protein